MSDLGKCPYCGSDMEKGCVLGNIGPIGSLQAGFRWHPGEPSILKNLIGPFMLEAEDLGEFEVGKGAYLTGQRCVSCKKLVLDY